MTKSNVLQEDWRRNRHSLKSVLIVLAYRVSSKVAQHPSRLVRIAGLPVRIVYKLVIEFMLGVELPDRVVCGPGLAVFHGVGLVVNANARLGRNVTLRQNTTIGAKREGEGAPIVGDDVSIGVNAVVIGAITVGARTIIGAGAVLAQDCPEDSVVYAARSTIKPAARGQDGCDG